LDVATGCFTSYERINFLRWSKRFAPPEFGYTYCWADPDEKSDLVPRLRSERSCVSILDLSPIADTDAATEPAVENTFSSLSWSHDGRYLARASRERR
jgi:hypothetical protein